MPALLIFALAASLGLHTVVLFVPEIDLSFPAEPPPLSAELKPVATTPPVRAAAAAPVVPAPLPPARQRRPPAAAGRPPAATPEVRAVAPAEARAEEPAEEPAEAPAEASAESVAGAAETPSETAAPPSVAADEGTGADAGLPDAATDGADAGPAMVAVAVGALPARGVIHYRVDRGDQGFQIGRATHSWETGDGVYRITAVTETSGLIGFFRPLRAEVESSGRLTSGGLLPERFVARQSGREKREQADFDWRQMQVHFAGRATQTLSPGAQDLLSLNYQLGLLGDLATGYPLTVVTGRKIARYRLEVLADEEIETPAGIFNTVHLRVAGVAATELWLARGRALLPVKIRYVDRKGNLYIQVATAMTVDEGP